MKGKGQVLSEAILIFIALALVGQTFFAMATTEKSRTLAINVPDKLLELYSSAENFEFYAVEAGGLSV
ncbi:unnamed protein product, partial [marine sediment metagenome]